MTGKLRELISRIWNGPGDGAKPADLQAFDSARETLIASCVQVTRHADAFGDLLRGMQGKPPPAASKAAANRQVLPRKSCPKKKSRPAPAPRAAADRKKVRKP